MLAGDLVCLGVVLISGLLEEKIRVVLRRGFITLKFLEEALL